MNLNQNEIEIILFSISVLNRFKSDLLPEDKIESISKYLNDAEYTLKNKASVSTLNVLSSMHLACSTVQLIIDNEYSVDIFTKSKCDSFSGEIPFLIDKLQNKIDLIRK